MEEIIKAVCRSCEEVMASFFPSGPKATVSSEIGRSFSAASRVVSVGVAGDYRGMLLLLYEDDQLKNLAEGFMGMPLEDGMEEYADEALIEIGNQIVARAAVEIANNGIASVDITPPSLLCSEEPMDLAWTRMKTKVIRVGEEPTYFQLAIGLSPGLKKFSAK